ncbi:MAG: ROK family protein [Blastocatellia bacterium]
MQKDTPPTPVDVSGRILLGIYLSSHLIRIGAVSGDGRLLSLHREPWQAAPGTPDSGPRGAAQLKTVIHRILAEKSAPGPVQAIGVGLPGLVHQATHRLVTVTNAPTLSDVDLYGELSAEFNLPLTFENNANAAAYAEMTGGAATGVGDWLYLSIGSGVGSGLVLDGKLRRGKSGYAGELGHINIDPDGTQCACGSFGCLETKASAANIVMRTLGRLRRDATSLLSKYPENEITYERIVEAAAQGDDLARLMMQRTGHYIGLAVADMINVLNLSMVAVGGAVAARPLLIPAIIEETRRRAFPPALADCQILPAKLGDEGGVIGAALIAGEKLAAA